MVLLVLLAVLRLLLRLPLVDDPVLPAALVLELLLAEVIPLEEELLRLADELPLLAEDPPRLAEERLAEERLADEPPLDAAVLLL